MADRTVAAFQVAAPLFNAIVAVLQELPARQVRGILNEIEGGAVTPIYEAGDFGGHKRTAPPTDAGDAGDTGD